MMQFTDEMLDENAQEIERLRVYVTALEASVARTFTAETQALRERVAELEGALAHADKQCIVLERLLDPHIKWSNVEPDPNSASELRIADRAALKGASE